MSNLIDLSIKLVRFSTFRHNNDDNLIIWADFFSTERKEENFCILRRQSAAQI